MRFDPTPTPLSRRSRSPGRRLLAAIGCLAFALTGLAKGSTINDLDDRERQTLMDMHVLVTAVEAYQQERGRHPGPTPGYVTAGFLGSHLEPEFIDAVPLKDAWGQEFLYASDGRSTSIVSFGADGVGALEYTAVVQAGAADAGDDLVWANNRFLHCPDHIRALIEGGAQKRTMGDVRSIAIAVESYKVDNGAVPGPTEGYVPVNYLRPFVQPTYIRVLPTTDGWDRPILYWSDGVHYRIVSNGRDGRPDGPYEDVVAGTAISSLDGDILFADGMFIRFPQGPQH
jgi:hypothetical protein